MHHLTLTFAIRKIGNKNWRYKIKEKNCSLDFGNEVTKQTLGKMKTKERLQGNQHQFETITRYHSIQCCDPTDQYPIKSKVKSISRRHQKKLTKFRNRQTIPEKISESNYMKHAVHNVPSYQLSEEETIVLSYGLDYHIPSKTNSNISLIQSLKSFIKVYYLIFHVYLMINS